MAELCLGTVQFGMKYGINNQIGRQPTWEESFQMLDTALENNINIIDTARAYGEAELILGEYFKNRKLKIDKIKIVSKLRPNIIELGEKDIYSVVRKEFEDSLSRLKITKLYGYLLHTPEYIYNKKIVESLYQLKKENLVEYIGVSIYDIKEGYAALETGIIDFIQLPYSILDQRGIKEGFIKRAKEKKIIIATRSAFLQGLFLMEYKEIPLHLQKAVPYLTKIDEIINKYNVDKISAILGFVKQEKDIDYLVFGVEHLNQLKENLVKFNSQDIPKECIFELKNKIKNIDQSIIFPSLWSNGKKAK